MLGIICAMDVEAEGLLGQMTSERKTNVIGYDFTEGKICGKKVVVAKSGIGKANAAAVTALMISCFKTDEIINLGVCGGINAGAMIIADSVVQYDFDTTAFGDPLGKLDGFDSPFIKCSAAMTGKLAGDKRGVIASGDKFIASKAESDRLFHRFGAIGFDMESGAVAQICTLAKVDFAVIRVVSDGGDAAEYEKFKLSAAKRGVSAVLDYIRRS